MPQHTDPELVEEGAHMRLFSTLLKKLHRLNLELSHAETLDALYLLAVEHARTDLGFDRCSLWLYNSDKTQLHGTYGTDERGSVCDEHSSLWVVDDAWLQEFQSEDTSVSIQQDAPLRDTASREIGRGWSITVALREGDTLIGVICVDNLLHQRPLQESQVELLECYAALVGHFCVHKRDREALKEKERYLQAIGTSLPKHMFYQLKREPDGSPRFLYISDSVERINGVKAEDVLNNALLLYDNTLEEYRSLLAQKEAESLRDGTVLDVEVQVRRTDGELRWLHLSSVPHRLPDGGTVWDGVQTDITERKRIEERLEESEAFLKMSQEVGSCGSWTWNPANNVVKWSDEMCRIHGISPPEFLGTLEQAIAFFHPDDQPNLRVGMERLIADHVFEPFIYRIIRPNGEERTLWGNGVVLLDTNGQFKEVVGTAHDITEYRQVESLLQEREAEIQGFLTQLKQLHDISISISSTHSLDTLCRRAVEHLRYQLGYDRVGIAFYNDDNTELHGVWGTDEKGDTRDEHNLIRKGLEPWSPKQWVKRGVVVAKDTLLFNCYPLKDVEVGRGWSVRVAIRDRNKVIGILSIESLHNSFGLAIGRNISYFGEFSPLSFYYGLGCWSLLC